MTFEEAMRHMLAGHKVRRNTWDIKWSVAIHKDDDESLHFVNEDGTRCKMTAEDVTEDDWGLA